MKKYLRDFGLYGEMKEFYLVEEVHALLKELFDDVYLCENRGRHLVSEIPLKKAFEMIKGDDQAPAHKEKEG